MRNSFSIIIGCFLFLAFTQSVAGQAPPTPRDSTIQGPQTFAWMMGISTYKFVRPLTYADKDAEMFRDFLKSPAGGKLKDDNIFCVLNENAKGTTFWVLGQKWLKAKNLQKGDRLYIYLAGHGDAVSQEEFYFLTYDCNPAGDKNNYAMTGNLPLYLLKSRISTWTRMGVDVVFIMDACRTNELPGRSEGQQALNSAVSEKNAGEIIMLATGAGQESLEDASVGTGHGLFTYYLIDGLNGMADSSGTVDGKITLNEIKKYVDKNVPSIAQERFKKKQDPYICCTEDDDKTINLVDTAYLRKWMNLKRLQNKGTGTAVAPRGRGRDNNPVDTLLIETYNLFNNAIKESRLTGKASAEYYYDQMAKKFPGNAYTTDAQGTLAVEFINFAQSKINLYLDCKDASSIQKIRAQIDESEKTDEINTSIDRMEKIARKEFYEVGNMLQRAIEFISPDDPDFAKTLMGKMYFFKARGYFGGNRKLVNINDAFQYAYTAYSSDKNAAYILNTLSSLHLDNNRMDSAVIYAKRAIAAAPKWRYPYVTLAFCYKTLNRPDSALKYYRKSVELDPTNADAYVDIGHYYYSLSRADSAISNYEKALRLEPNNVYASNNIGWLYHDKKNYDKAISYFKMSINADPKFINAYNGLSKTFFEIKEFDSARIYYSKAFANYQDKSTVNLYIGNFYRDLKEYDSAKVYYRQSAILDPNDEQAFNNLGRASFALKQYDSATYFYSKALQANPSSAFALINIGMVYKELKQPDSTYSYFHQAVNLEPNNPSILNNLGVIYAQDKLIDSAKIYFRKALMVKPDYSPASKNLLKIFKDLNQLDSATHFLKGNSDEDVNSTSLLNDLGQMFLGQKRYDSARAYYKRAIVLEPKNAQLFNNLGLVFREMKQYDSAKTYLQKAMELDPDNPTMWINLAKVYGSLRQYDSAGYYYKKQLFLKTDVSANAYETIGAFYDGIKVYDSAIVYFKKALELDPTFLPAINNIGAAYMNLEQNDSALRYYKLAVMLDSTYESAALNLGLLFHSIQKYDSAIVYISEAIRLDPKPKSYFRLACSYSLNNQVEPAITYLKMAYEKGYKNYDALITDPDLDGLKNHKEFQALLDKYIPDKKDRQ